MFHNYINSKQCVCAFVLVVIIVTIPASFLITGNTLKLLGVEDLLPTYAITFTVLLTVLPAVYWIARTAYQLQQEKHTWFHLAHTDHLTDLPNRRAFFTHGNQMLASGRAAQQTTALMLVDVNNFKDINDTLGHTAGDEALYFVGQTLKTYAEPNDLVARLGGDEFALLRRDATRQDIVMLSSQISQCLAHSPYYYKDTVLALTLSIGISDTTHADTMEGLLETSDIALYMTKKDHRR